MSSTISRVKFHIPSDHPSDGRETKKVKVSSPGERGKDAQKLRKSKAYYDLSRFIDQFIPLEKRDEF